MNCPIVSAPGDCGLGIQALATTGGDFWAIALVAVGLVVLGWALWKTRP